VRAQGPGDGKRVFVCDDALFCRAMVTDVGADDCIGEKSKREHLSERVMRLPGDDSGGR
jgi:hypothetical protein